MVQHLEGGIVKEIVVRDGEIVKEGEVLIRISPTATESEFQQLQARRAILELQVIRLNAVLNDKVPAFEKYQKSYPDLVSSEKEIYYAQLKTHRSQLNLADTKIKQRQEELAREKNKVSYLNRELKVLRQQANMRKDLVDRGLVSRAEYLERKGEMAETETQYQQSLSNVLVSKESLAEAQQALVELDNQYYESIKKEIGKVSGELIELNKTLLKFEDRVSRLEITSPVSGVVTGLSINTIQSVIKPGETVMEIVPAGDELIVESRVNTSDIGHVYIGQEAEVKINSYDPHRFGTVMGKVRQISASTFLDEQQVPYYRAKIALEMDYLHAKDGKYKIIPGMTVQADIKTGEKSVLDYLLKPIYRGFQNAFQER